MNVTFKSPTIPVDPIATDPTAVAIAQDTVTQVCCPNCGHPAERYHLYKESLVRTQCPACDYLMITCSKTGRVIEAYAPGIVYRPR